MNITRTAIVDPALDVLWADISALIGGTTKKEILILTSEYAPGSNDDTQLQKMLGACGLQEEQYNIIQIKAGQKAAWHQLREKLDPKIVFLIGVHPEQLGIAALFSINVPNNYNERTWLPTLSLPQLEENKEAKKQLWVNGMKPLFVDKAVNH